MMHASIAILLLQATLGAETRAPTPEEVKSYALIVETRPVGQIVLRVEEGSPAAKAGMRAGDAILKFGGVKIYSRDHLEDVMRVSKAGAELALVLKRPNEAEREVKATLGKSETPAKGIAWQFASLEQLPAALERAKKEGKTLLVGLSGAET